MTPAAPHDLVVTRATLADWPVISAWAAAEGWNPGLSDGPAFFAQDPDGFFLGRIDGEPVSAISVVNHGPDYAFLGCYLVRPDLRGHGHGLTTWKTALAHAGSRTVGLDGVVAQQDNYRQSGFRLAHRTASGSPASLPRARRPPVCARPGPPTCPPSPPTTAPATPPTAPGSSPSGSPDPATMPWSARTPGASPATA
ncbi:hypothetical protein GCM10017687_04270 [Streptomyces echinatus]